MTLFEKILVARGIDLASATSFFVPDYEKSKHDPFLLSDMVGVVQRLEKALKKQEKITIYGDYDIDGLTASTLLFDAFKSFGFQKVDIFIPNRFSEGFGLSAEVIKNIAKQHTSLIVTVDCGSNNAPEIKLARQFGVDVLVTDHHEITHNLPKDTLIVNPKRSDSKYPFSDLAGVGVAFKLVQALQTKLPGLPLGQEKWLLDLVALGTVCDVVPLIDENRTNVYWGLKVLAKSRRQGLKALMDIADISPDMITSRSLGFGLGPRMNATGRLETAQYALDLLLAENKQIATQKAQILEDFNTERREIQNLILQESIVQAKKYKSNPVLVLSAPNWNHGVVGIVASKILEKFQKPTFIIQEMGDESKGSARSYGDYNIASAVSFANDVVTNGGGHKLAAGVTLPTKNIAQFRKMVNEFYQQNALNLLEQQKKLLPVADAEANLSEVDEELIFKIDQLEPFGNGNTKPVFKSTNLVVQHVSTMGSQKEHLKIQLQDQNYLASFVAFNAPKTFFVNVDEKVNVWYQPTLNEWRGCKSVENKILYLEKAK